MGQTLFSINLPKNLDQSRQFRRMGLHSGVRQKGKNWDRVTRQVDERAPTAVGGSAEGKRTERFSEKSLNLEKSLKSEVRLPSSKETLPECGGIGVIDPDF
jgi:hypothetical protein